MALQTVLLVRYLEIGIRTCYLRVHTQEHVLYIYIMYYI